MNTTEKTEAICCPRFDPEPWHDQIIVWDQKPFIRDYIRTFLYMPLNMDKVMTRLFALADAAGAHTPEKLCLSEHTSRWKMAVYLAVTHPCPEGDNTRMSGRYYARVYEGPFRDTGKWMADFAQQVAVKPIYQWYTTCPTCAKKYGKNYVVLFGLLP